MSLNIQRMLEIDREEVHKNGNKVPVYRLNTFYMTKDEVKQIRVNRELKKKKA